MKKAAALMLIIVMISAMFAVNASAASKWYFFQEVEDTTITLGSDKATSGLKTVSVETASGGKLVSFIGSAETDISLRNRFSFSVNIPANGTYTVWIRALVATTEKCDLYHTASSAIYTATGSQSGINVWRLDGVPTATAAEPVYHWYKLNVTDKKGANDATSSGAITLNAGNATMEFSTRAGTDKTFKFDCVIVTDDLAFDPASDNWEDIRDGKTTTAAETTTAAATTAAATTAAATDAKTVSESEKTSGVETADALALTVAVLVISAGAVTTVAVKSKKEK